MRRGLIAVAVLLLAAPAAAEEIKNPDVPFGGIAVDFFADTLANGKVYFYSDYYPGEVKGKDKLGQWGVAVMIPLSARSTVFLRAARYDARTTWVGIPDWSEAAGMRLGLRLRLYLGG